MTLTASFADAAAFLAAWEAEISKGGLLVRGAAVANAQAGAACTLQVSVAGGAAMEVPARVAAVVPGVGVAVMFDGVPEALKALSEPAPSPSTSLGVNGGLGVNGEEEAPRGTLYDRLKAMTVAEKMALALAGTREERTALFRDVNKMIHVFVLKNPRIGLDEVQGAAKQPNLSPDALKMIAEHKEWSMNPGVCTSLVRNPKTPMPLALRMLERVPMTDIRSIAKGGAREQLVQAARKKLNG